MTKLKELTYWTAFGIGCFQVLAMVPGTSRSGATIVGALLIGVARPVAAEFTFFLAIPTMVAASGLKLIKFGFNYTGHEIAVLLTGCVVSFLVSVFAIKFLMGYIKKHDFTVFGYYRIILGVVVLGYFLILLKIIMRDGESGFDAPGMESTFAVLTEYKNRKEKQDGI